jgi:hypothetical protein
MNARLRNVLPCCTVPERRLNEMVSGSNRPAGREVEDSAGEATDDGVADSAAPLDSCAWPSEHPPALSSAGTTVADTNSVRSR